MCGLRIFAGLLSTFRDSNIKSIVLSVVSWFIKCVLCAVIYSAIYVLLTIETCDDLEIRTPDASRSRSLKVTPVNSSVVIFINYCNRQRNLHRFDRSIIALFLSHPLALTPLANGPPGTIYGKFSTKEPSTRGDYLTLEEADKKQYMKLKLSVTADVIVQLLYNTVITHKHKEAI